MGKIIDLPTRKLKRAYWKAIRRYWGMRDSSYYNRTEKTDQRAYARKLSEELTRRGWPLS